MGNMDNPAGVIYKFPEQPKKVTFGASWWQVLRSRIRTAVGRLLNRRGIPAPIQPIEITDPLTGQTIQVRVGDLFTRLSIDGRDFYFDRITGRYDGTGCGCNS